MIPNVQDLRKQRLKLGLGRTRAGLRRLNKNRTGTTQSESGTRWFKIEILSESDDFFYRATQTTHMIQ